MKALSPRAACTTLVPALGLGLAALAAANAQEDGGAPATGPTTAQAKADKNPAAAAAPAQSPGEDKSKGRQAPLSTAVSREMLDGLAAEIQRAVVKLDIPRAPKPYLISYKVTEVEVNDASATLGAVLAQRDRHFVNLESHVHVGDYKFDNSNFVLSREEDVDGIGNIQLPLEARPALARRAAWLATDLAFKEALAQYTDKRDAQRTGALVADVPSYSKAEPVVIDEPVRVPALEDLDHLKKRATAVSQVFRDQMHLRDSRVAFTSFLERRWILNNEGTSAQDVRRVSGVVVVATTQADDGDELSLYYSRYGLTEADLPDDAELKKQALQLSKQLEALRTAPLVDNYTGPILFEGGGAVDIVRTTLAPALSGTPRPSALSGQNRLGGQLDDRIGLRVLAPMLSIVDDPTTSRHDKLGLIGGYRVDDEGVAARRIEVVKNGVLKTLLMSRTPSKQIGQSNGHARGATIGGIFRGSTTNLFVTGQGGLPRQQLVRKLLAEARAQGLPYGIIIRQLDDAAVTANPELSRIELFQLLQSQSQDAPPLALLAYRVYPDGREELVRGAQLAPVPIRAWRDVLAVGKQTITLNYLGSPDGQADLRLAGSVDGFVPSSGIESSITTPDLLFRELDLTRSTAGRRAKPAVNRPTP